MGTTDPVQIEEARKSTQDLIDNDNEEIAIIRETFERTPGGGIRKTDSDPQPPKPRFFSEAIGLTGMGRTVITEQGEQIVSTHVLIGLWNDDIQKDDEFVIGNRKFRVAAVDFDRDYQTRAWCVQRS